MSSIKNSKPELIAIYRLEFYKKKNNWKFCANEKRKVVQPTKRLNKTYNVELDEKVDTDIQAIEQPLKETSLPKKSSQRPTPKQLPESANQKPWPTPKETNNTNQPQIPRQTLTEVENESETVNQPKPTKWTNWKKMVDNWRDLNEDQIGIDCSEVQTISAEDCDSVNRCWAEIETDVDDQQIWTEIEQMWNDDGQVQLMEAVNTQYVDDGRSWPHGNQLPVYDGWPDEEIREAATTLLAAETCVRADLPRLLGQSVSEDSCAEFLRGAHAAPHSSEMDLRFDRDGEPKFPLSHLSADQLSRRIASLAAVLRTLLLELSERTVKEQPPVFEQPHNTTVEECPTRDIGPSAPTDKIHIPLKRDLTYLQDDFLAGSFMQAPEGYLEDSAQLQASIQEDIQAYLQGDRLIELTGIPKFVLDKNPVLDAAGEGRFLQMDQGFMVSGGVNGRGRGRVKPVIGIGKGRPFRL